MKQEATECGRGVKPSSNRNVDSTTTPPTTMQEDDNEGVPPIAVPRNGGAPIVPEQPQPGAFAISISGRVNDCEEDDGDADDSMEHCSLVLISSAYLVEEHKGSFEEQVQQRVSQQLQETNQEKNQKNLLLDSVVALLVLGLLSVLLGLGLSGAFFSKTETPPSDARLQSSRSPFDTVNGFSWKKLGQSLFGQAEHNWFGFCVALSADGSIMAVGAPGNNGKGGRESGHVQTFQLDNSKWVQLGQAVEGKFAFNNLGTAVALSSDGKILAVGGVASKPGTGRLEIHRRDDGSETWVQMGQTLKTEGLGNFFGASVALSVDGTVVAVGADGNDGNGEDAGHARVFSYDNTIALWVQKGQDLDGESAGDWFGRSLALSADGDIVAAGGIYNDGTNGPDTGHARVFSFDSENSTWMQMGQDLDGQSTGDMFGRHVAVSADGNILAVGADGSNQNGVFSGHVRTFCFNTSSSSWEQMGQDLYGVKSGDEFGSSVSLSADGRILSVGSDNEASYGGDGGYVRAFAYDSSASKWGQIGQELEGAERNDFFLI